MKKSERFEYFYFRKDQSRHPVNVSGHKTNFPFFLYFMVDIAIQCTCNTVTQVCMNDKRIGIRRMGAEKL